MEKPSKYTLVTDHQRPTGYHEVYDANSIDAWIAQEMAKKVELDEEKIKKIANSLYYDFPQRSFNNGQIMAHQRALNQLAQAICSRAGEIVKKREE